MAQKIVLVDDIDGSPAAETVRFSIDSASYAIDLSEDNAAALREALAPYVGHAQRVSSARPRSAAKSRGASAADIRAWAQEEGIEVSSRGRIPSEVVAAYEAATG